MCLAPATLTVSFSALLHTPAPLTLLSFPSSLLSPCLCPGEASHCLHILSLKVSLDGASVESLTVPQFFLLRPGPRMPRVEGQTSMS